MNFMGNPLLFNYISFCRYFYSNTFEIIIFNLIDNSEKHEILQNELLKIYISENTKFTYFGFFDQFDYQILDIPGAKQCFSELRSIYCGVFMNNNVITELLGCTNLLVNWNFWLMMHITPIMMLSN
jgi:hypothetical protein